MKVKVKNLSYLQVLEQPSKQVKKPKKPSRLFRTLVRLLSIPDLVSTNFKYKEIGMDKLKKKEPIFILMNHSAFIDLKIASKVLHARPYNIVATSDSFISRNWLMREIGCIPTKKFTTDKRLVRDMLYTINDLKSSILMYPEAGYSFDGKMTPIPESIVKCIRMLNIPVVSIITKGAFFRQPLYNNLRTRKVKVEAEVEYLFSKEDIEKLTDEEIYAKIIEKFSFDNFKWQQENNILIKDKTRAEGLERILYKCPHCLAEGQTKGVGEKLICNACGKEYQLTEDGYMKALDGVTEFDHIPDWYNWERQCVKAEVESFELSKDVEIYMMKDTHFVYKIEDGHLCVNKNGYTLTNDNNTLEYKQPIKATHSINVDFFWYEIGDTISIGDSKALFFCFPKDKSNVCCKTRFFQEEMYKIETKK